MSLFSGLPVCAIDLHSAFVHFDARDHSFLLQYLHNWQVPIFQTRLLVQAPFEQYHATEIPWDHGCCESIQGLGFQSTDSPQQARKKEEDMHECVNYSFRGSYKRSRSSENRFETPREMRVVEYSSSPSWACKKHVELLSPHERICKAWAWAITFYYAQKITWKSPDHLGAILLTCTKANNCNYYLVLEYLTLYICACVRACL